MTPLPFVWPHALVFWAVLVWVFRPEAEIIRRARLSAGPEDAKSMQVISIGMPLVIVVAFGLAFVPAFRLAPAHPVAIFYAGVVAIVAGGLLRRHCWRMLGASFTGDVRARPHQDVVTRGAYAFVRHPSYTAAIVVHAGIAVALGSWASTLLVVAAALVVYGYRIRVEERVLLAAIGDPYRRFMATRKRLIPFVY